MSIISKPLYKSFRPSDSRRKVNIVKVVLPLSYRSTSSMHDCGCVVFKGGSAVREESCKHVLSSARSENENSCGHKSNKEYIQRAQQPPRIIYRAFPLGPAWFLMKLLYHSLTLQQWTIMDFLALSNSLYGFPLFSFLKPLWCVELGLQCHSPTTNL